MMTAFKVTSEILEESDNTAQTFQDGSVLSEFSFKYPSYMLTFLDNHENNKYDDDNDLDIDRQQEGVLQIEHNISTNLELVGLQIWRGAFLLADYILSNPDLFRQKKVLELGSGVGLTSIVAGILASDVICTDINDGGILKMIQRNFIRNNSYVKARFSVEELNFFNLTWSSNQHKKFNEEIDIILAADVIYDDKITDAFIDTLVKLLSGKPQKTAYISLEKRYVFTIADMDTVAPMYEEFLSCIKKKNCNWSVEYVQLDFPRYFKYNRTKHMVLMKIENKT
ncbi:methyltransferase-like protein 22 [Prorops nasuta]|uniref:methyltransferase-like protein 22 n=1 Tax=Prorops nasuta TaxID=863751 RepID=UPI0034CE0ACA